MRYLEKMKIVKITKKSDQFFHGCDYLRINLDEFIFVFSPFFEKINTTNSNFLYFDFLGITFSVQNLSIAVGKSLIFSVSFNGLPVPVFIYTHFSGINTHGKKAKIDFYGSFFRLIEVGEIPDNFIDEFFKHFAYFEDKLDISRIDYALDFMSNEKIIKGSSSFVNSKYLKNVNSVDYKNKKANSHNRTLGTKASKRIFVRCYDKLLDSKEKGKFLLYDDYFKYNFVQRLEFEFGFKFCKGYSIKNINYLFNKIHFLLGIYYGKVNKLYENEYRYIPCALTDYNKMPYVQQFCKRGEFLSVNGLDPFKILTDYLNAQDIQNFNSTYSSS